MIYLSIPFGTSPDTKQILHIFSLRKLTTQMVVLLDVTKLAQIKQDGKVELASIKMGPDRKRTLKLLAI